MRHSKIAAALLGGSSAAHASTLFVASYAGNITTLSLTESLGAYTVTKTHITDGCAPNPSWLTLDREHGVLYCLDEGLYVANGSLSSFTVGSDGELELVQKASTISGPVSGVLYGDPAVERAIALAHYTGSAVSDWVLNSTDVGGFAFNEDIPEQLNHTGPNVDRQEASHEHEVILDPTGQYVLAPDLGADLVRIFSIDPKTLKLVTETPLSVVPGSGPRHAVFYQPYGVSCENCTSFMFLVTELGNTVTSYAVSYPKAGGMAFEQVWNSTVYGGFLGVPEGNAAAEILVSPDNRFLVISNRNDSSFALPQANGSTLHSDSITTFELQRNGSATFHQVWPAGGSYPRHISMNKYGDLVAVGLQYSDQVVILQRDVESGLIGEPVARTDITGNVTNVQWWN